MSLARSIRAGDVGKGQGPGGSGEGGVRKGGRGRDRKEKREGGGLPEKDSVI